MGKYYYEDNPDYKDIISKPTRNEETLRKQFEEQANWIKGISKRSNTNKAVITKRKNRAKTDFKYFVKTYLEHYCKDKNGKLIELAPFHLDAANRIDVKHNFIGLFQWARNHGKTSVSMFIILWLIIRRDIHNLVYVSKSKDFSITQLQNIQNELLNNILLVDDFGPFKEKGSEWRADRFEVPSYDLACSALGRGQSPRGIKYRNYRPDFILIDDIDDNENSRSDRRVRQLIDWWNSELKPSTATEYKILFIGNKFNDNSLIGHFEKIKNIYKTRVNAFQDTGKVAWPERFTKDWLLKEKEIIGNIEFQREYMNNPVKEGLLFKYENIHLKDMSIDDFNTVVLYIDPSWTSNSDYKCVVAIGKKDGIFSILDVFLKKCTMRTMIKWIFDYYLLNYDKTSFRIYQEGNAGQSYLKKEYETMEKEYGVTLNVLMDKKKNTEKYARIEAITPYFERDIVFFNMKLEEEKDFKEALSQLTGFERNGTMNDDFPDALSGAINKINILGDDNKNEFNPIMDLANSDHWEW
jgi:predicted phage terminase large subunit-like protein